MEKNITDIEARLLALEILADELKQKVKKLIELDKKNKKKVSKKLKVF